MKHYNITISGKVQGVFFRANTQDKARELGVKGLVRNEPDGTVYIEAEADEDILEKFIDWCKEGSPQANVEEVKLEESEIVHHTGFTIDRA